MAECVCKDCGQKFHALSVQRKLCNACKLNGPPASEEMPEPESVHETVFTAEAETKELEPEVLVARNPEPITTGMTVEQMQQMLKMQAEMMKEFAKELRKPTEAEELKAKEDEARRLERIRKHIEAARMETEARQAFVAACAANGHRNGRGRQVISGQITSGNGKFQALCQICGHLFPPIDPVGDLPGQQFRSGFKFPEVVEVD